MTATRSSKLVGVERPNLVVPDHVAAQQGSQKLRLEREKTWSEDGLAESDIPHPVGWRVMIEPIEIKKETKGGLALPDMVMEAAEYMRYVGLVVALGPTAYQHAKFGDVGPWCKAGDWVIHGRYAGQEANIQGDELVHSFRFVNDDEILAVTDHPERLIMYAGIV